jgi:hypothetical protein
LQITRRKKASNLLRCLCEALNAKEAMSTALRSIGLFGIVLFGVLFAMTFVSSDAIENSAKGFVKYQIEKEVRAKQQFLSESKLADKALGIAKKLGIKSEQIQHNIENDLPEKIANYLTSHPS